MTAKINKEATFNIPYNTDSHGVAPASMIRVLIDRYTNHHRSSKYFDKDYVLIKVTEDLQHLFPEYDVEFFRGEGAIEFSHKEKVVDYYFPIVDIEDESNANQN